MVKSKSFSLGSFKCYLEGNGISYQGLKTLRAADI